MGLEEWCIQERIIREISFDRTNEFFKSIFVSITHMLCTFDSNTNNLLLID